MKLKNNIKTAVAGITTHKSRSILTLLGIVIGIASIMMIISVGNGAESLILKEVSGMGAETVIIRPGKEPKGPTDIAGTLFADSLKVRDLEALKRKSNVPFIEDIAPVVIVAESASYLGETFRPQIFGWSAEFLGKILNVYPQEGAFFGEDEISQKANVVVIGAKVKKELFGEGDALGKYIKIKNKKFRVIGILPSKGQVAFFNMDDVVVMPYSTAQSYLLGIDHYNEIAVRVQSADLVSRTIDDIKRTLRDLHNISNPNKDDFFVVTQEGVINQIKNIIGVLTAFLASVVAISLVVGGIGVMNIMLVSVTERTKEIGLRKAIGATENNILVQFLMEAMMLTALGGIIGILFGSFLSFIVALVLKNVMLLNWTFSFPVVAATLGFGVSAIVGLIFGIYPAYQASKKSPMEALRYE